MYIRKPHRENYTKTSDTTKRELTKVVRPLHPKMEEDYNG